MKTNQPIRTLRRIPWIIASCALLSSIANLVTGIILLASNQTGGDIALGVLTTTFAVWGMTGSILALVFIIRQNRYNMLQARFIAQVSHELRTPITSIRMYADTLMLRRFKNEDEENGLLNQMDAEIVRLEQLTEQILCARTRPSPIPDEKIDLSAALHDALRPFLIDPKNDGRIDLQIDDDLPKVRVVPSDYVNAASNLIRNALTHGGPGTVHITLQKTPDNACILTVRDEGNGIPPDIRDKLFQPFLRGRNTTDSGIPGFGLGLSIVRDFASKYHADIGVSNHPQGGAVFSLTVH